jgi:hypothetical protein
MEAAEQVALFQWANIVVGMHPELKWMFAIPNGGSRKGGAIEGKHLKDQGVKAGVSDIFLPCARGGYHGLFIEMKRVKNSVVSDSQSLFQHSMIEAGYRATIARGWQEARDVILEYLSLKP